MIKAGDKGLGVLVPPILDVITQVAKVLGVIGWINLRLGQLTWEGMFGRVEVRIGLHMHNGSFVLSLLLLCWWHRQFWV